MCLWSARFVLCKICVCILWFVLLIFVCRIKICVRVLLSVSVCTHIFYNMQWFVCKYVSVHTFYNAGIIMCETCVCTLQHVCMYVCAFWQVNYALINMHFCYLYANQPRQIYFHTHKSVSSSNSSRLRQPSFTGALSSSYGLHQLQVSQATKQLCSIHQHFRHNPNNLTNCWKSWRQYQLDNHLFICTFKTMGNVKCLCWIILLSGTTEQLGLNVFYVYSVIYI